MSYDLPNDYNILLICSQFEYLESRNNASTSNGYPECNNEASIRRTGKTASFTGSNTWIALGWHTRSILCSYSVPRFKRRKYTFLTYIRFPESRGTCNFRVKTAIAPLDYPNTFQFFDCSYQWQIHFWKNIIYPTRVSFHDSKRISNVAGYADGLI